MPETGSALDAGQRPLIGFFRGPHPPGSPFVVGVSPLGCEVATGIVYVDDPDDEDARDDEELVRCALLRGMSIRVTSSALMGFNPPWPPLPVFHRAGGWRLGGDATAVICVMMAEVKDRI